METLSSGDRPHKGVASADCAKWAINRMTDESYPALAGVYEWLVPDALLTSEGAVAAFAGVVVAARRQAAAAIAAALP